MVKAILIGSGLFIAGAIVGVKAFIIWVVSCLDEHNPD